MDDVERIRSVLSEVERSSADLRWADRRPWRAATHVGWRDGLPEIDLHDLDARHAREAVRAVVAGELQTGAVRFVTGRGRHSVGPGVLGKVVRGELRRVCRDRDWRFRPAGPARWVLITDASRAPSAATGALGPAFWLVVALIAGATLLLVARLLGFVG